MLLSGRPPRTLLAGFAPDVLTGVEACGDLCEGSLGIGLRVVYHWDSFTAFQGMGT